jgi:hypothetical protein
MSRTFPEVSDPDGARKAGESVSLSQKALELQLLVVVSFLLTFS